MGKNMVVDIMGKDAPPVSKYKAEKYKSIEKNDSHKALFSKETRFP
jgi:hypothetical protein